MILSNELDVKDCKSDKSLKSILTSISERRLIEIFFNFKWAFPPKQTINTTFKFVINYKCVCRISFLWHAHAWRHNHCLLVAEILFMVTKKFDIHLSQEASVVCREQKCLCCKIIRLQLPTQCKYRLSDVQEWIFYLYQITVLTVQRHESIKSKILYHGFSYNFYW